MNFGGWGLTPWQIEQLIKREMRRTARKYASKAFDYGTQKAISGTKSLYQAAKGRFNSNTGSTAVAPYMPTTQGPGYHRNPSKSNWDYYTGYKNYVPSWLGTPYTYEGYYEQKQALSKGPKHKGFSKTFSGSRYKGLSRKRNY